MRRDEGAATRRLLDQIQWQEVTVAIADRAGDLARRYLRWHPGVDAVDHLIAAAVLELGADLKTRNVKHFPMFPQLAPAYS